MIITAATPTDISNIIEIRNKAFSRFAPESYSDQEVQTLLADLDEEHLRQMIDDGKIFIMKNDQVLGCAGWDADSIRHVYVDPARTREGIASRLLAHTEKNYKERTKNDHVFAGVALYARPFYEANGYTFVSEEKDWDDSKYCKMKKTFAPSRLRGEKNSEFEIMALSTRPEFAGACAAWSFAQWGCMLDDWSLEQTMAGYKQPKIDENGLPATWICLYDGKPAGSIRLKKSDHPDLTHLTPWLASLFVHPHFRGRGVAKALCRKVEEEARTRFGFDKLYLFTPDADKLYESLGWRRIDTVRDPLGLHPAGEVLMQKDLVHV